MVLSYYITKYPYALLWHTKRLLGNTEGVVLYCANILDYQIFAPVQKHLKPLPVVTKDRRAQRELRAIGVESSRLPSFPDGVIMCRQAAYRFPVDSIKKIGMRHGAYHFKPFANPNGYNMLDRFLMTSSAEVKQAQIAGIHCGVAIGFPKLDSAFDGSVDAGMLDAFRQNTGLNPNKKNILFTATWDNSGLSAVDQWADKLAPLVEHYNVLVTVHPWTAEGHIDKIRNTPGVFYIGNLDIIPYIIVSDVCIGDASSILAECCALDKPMVTFKMPKGKRTVPHVQEMIRNMSLQIENIKQLSNAIQHCLDAPEEKHTQRAKANRIMFDKLDGEAGKRAADEIIKLFPHLQKTVP